MVVRKFVELFDVSLIDALGLSGNLSSSVSIWGDVSDTLLSLSLPVASGVVIGDQINSLVLRR